MKFRFYVLTTFLTVISLFVTNCSASNSQTDNFDNLPWVSDVGARQMPKGENSFCVNDFGAVSDTVTMNTKAIQAAIDSCSKSGGGTVFFKPGTYTTGSVYIKEGVTFRIDEGVTILGSKKIADYPEIDTRVAGIEMRWPSALINVIDQKNVAITGKGTINAQGKPFWDIYWKMRKEYEPKGLRWIVDYDAKRPRTLLISNSTDVTVDELTFQQAGFWTVHILYSEYVTVNGIIIRNNVGGHGPSTDGIDIDSSSKILVKNCDIDCNDDNFCLKSGRDADGLRVNRPTEYVVIRDCISRKGGGLITFGSETSGGIRNVLAQNLKAHGTGVGLRFKSAITRGGTVENIYIDSVQMDGVGTAIEATLNWNPSYSYSTLPKGYSYDNIPKHWKVMLEKVPEDKGLPVFQNIYISHIDVKNAGKGVMAAGLKKSYLKNFNFSDVNISSKTAGELSFAQGWNFKNVKITADNKLPLKTSDCKDMKIQ